MKMKRVVVAGLVLIGIVGLAGCATKGDVERLEAEIARIDRNGKALTDSVKKMQSWTVLAQQRLWPTPGPGDPPAAPPPPPDWQ